MQPHRAEMDKIRGAIIFDSGTRRTPGFQLRGRGDMRDGLGAAIGTYIWDFLLDAVPTMVADQAEANYLPNYHAASDTLDKVDIREVKLNTTVAALTAWGLADRPAPLGKRLSRAELETLMKESGLDQQMKSMGYWGDWEKGVRGRQP